MNTFWVVLAAAIGVFGLMAAALALRQHRHPDAGAHHGDDGCAHPQQKIKCLQCPSRLPSRDAKG